MADSDSFDRRKFIKACVGAGAAVAADPSLMAQPVGELVPAERVRLVDTGGKTLRADALTVGQSYVFHYPYVTTPCFLIDLGSPAEPGDELETSQVRLQILRRLDLDIKRHRGGTNEVSSQDVKTESRSIARQ